MEFIPGYHERTPSPRVRQEGWSNLYGNNESKVDFSDITYTAPSPITCAEFSKDGILLLAGCEKGEVVILDTFTGDCLLQLEEVLPSPIDTCQFSQDGVFAFYSWQNSIFICSADNGKLLATINTSSGLTYDELKPTVKSLHVIPNQFDKLLSITCDKISIWSWQYTKTNDVISFTNPFEEKPLSVANGVRYVCGTVTLDGNYVIACDTCNKIRIWNLNTMSLVHERSETCETIISLDTHANDLDDNSLDDIILLITTKDSVKLWSLHPAELTDLSLKRNKLTEIYSGYYDSERKVKLACVDSKNNVSTYDGLKEANKIPKDKTKRLNKVIAINYFNDKVAIGLENGNVFEYNCLTTDYKQIMLLEDEPIKYLEYMNDNTLVASGARGSLMFRINERNQKIIDGSILTKKDDHQLIIKCFMWNDLKRFISVTRNYRVKCWKFVNGLSCKLETVLISDSVDGSCISMATLSQFQDKLALADENGIFQVYNLCETISDTTLKANHNQGGKLEKLKSCCFSPDGTILALGQANGKIQVSKISYILSLT